MKRLPDVLAREAAIPKTPHVTYCARAGIALEPTFAPRIAQRLPLDRARRAREKLERRRVLGNLTPKFYGITKSGAPATGDHS